MSKYLDLFHKLNSAAPLTRNSDVLIIDGTNTFIRIFSNVPSLNDNGDHVGGVVGFLRSVGALIRQVQPTRCIIVFDGKGGSQRRRKLYPDYKNNRKIKTKLNRFDEFKDLTDEADSMKRQFGRIIQYLDSLPITLISIDNIEADDTIAYLTELLPNSNITISSTDKDFLQLVNDKIQVWNPVKKITYTPEKIKQEFGILPENYIIYKIMNGDSSDNIPGINGIGLKTLLKHFPELNEYKLTVDDVIKKCINENSLNPKSKFFKNIISGIDDIKRNNILMQLSIADFSAHAKLIIQNLLSGQVDIDKRLFLQLFFEDGLNTLIKDPHMWLHSTFNKLVSYGRDIK